MYHGSVELSPDVELQDVVAGIAYWLTQNPTETVLVSLKQDDQLTATAVEADIEAEFAKLFTNETLAPHWVQLDNQVGGMVSVDLAAADAVLTSAAPAARGRTRQDDLLQPLQRRARQLGHQR